MTERKLGPVEKAVADDLEAWGPKVAETSLAALALDAAQRLDGPISPTPASMLHAQLRATLGELAALAAEVTPRKADAVDEVKRKRTARRDARGA